MNIDIQQNNQKSPNMELNLEYQPIFTLPLINEPAPPFKAQSTKGPINFPADYKGKWVLFYSYPGDFCATCTTELLALTQNKELYDELGVEIVALSIDSIFSHIAWLKSIYDLDFNEYKNVEVDFPLIADTNMEISRKYGLLRRGETETETVRGGFLIDPNGKIRVIQIYPREVGASGEEIRRIIQAVQKADKEQVYTPANWKPGDKVLLPKPESLPDAIDVSKYNDPDGEIFCPSWYLCYKKDTAVEEKPATNFFKSNSSYYKKPPISSIPKKLY